jgi:hypothetical protein
MQSLLKKTIAITALTIPVTATAGTDASDQERRAQWKQMRTEAVSAASILSGDVTSALNAVGTVEELILSDNSRDIQYVLYDVPYPYGYSGSDDGFVAFENVALEHGSFDDLDVRFDDAADVQASDRLRLTAAEADHRAVSRLMGEPVVFDNDQKRTLSDILVHPQSGKVTHFVIEMNPEAIFTEEPRAIPANRVRIEKNGRMSASLTLAEAREMKDYDRSML